MTAGCARCGSCCDPVPFTREQHERAVLWTTEALDGVPGPEDDAGWAYWLEHGWEQEHRDEAIAWFSAAGVDQRVNADFIAAHWKPLGDGGCACDMYDREARLCMAQDSKPPVCSRYPWYGRGPDADDGAHMPLQCSYLADLPREKRPEGARPLIPLTVVSRERVPA